ncbi:MAG: ComEC/Rec2 family competence protein [Gemmatimonadetes bacterium]|nr:ComEC/Rec2 family competence protein [Gemmatimonadota bacterium]
MAVVGTWHREAPRRPAIIPVRPSRAGRLVVLRLRPIAAPPGVRARLRLGAERRLANLFGPDRAGLAAALTIGPGEQIPVEIRQRFARAGIAHLLSISGLHVGLLAAALILLLRAARVPLATARVAGTALVAGYVWLLGFPAPAVRGAGLVALWCWAHVRQRPPVAYAALATTAIVVVVLDPFAVFDAGPWLSFAGAWGCVAAARWWRRTAAASASARERRWIRAAQPGVVSLGATLATAPVSVLAFGTMSPAAVVANLAAIPLAAALMPALALALALGAVPLPGAESLAVRAAAAAGLGLDLLDWVTRLAGALPLATVSFERRLLGAGVLGLVAWTMLRGGDDAHTPRAWRIALIRRVGLAGLVGLAAALWWPELRRERSGYRPARLALHFLAVGQGDAAVLRTPAGRWLVIDGGPRTVGYDAGARRVVPFLRRQGAERLAVVVASHGDADHLGGLPAVLRAYRADLVLEPGEPLGRRAYRSWLASVAKNGARWRRARAGDRLEVDGVTLRVWHPDGSWLRRRMPANENSVVLTVEYAEFRAVFPGDAGLPMEAVLRGAIGPVTLLKVGHHGSRSASGPSWLAALRPAICVISVGPNRYGHPDRATLGGLAASGCRSYRTDRAGEVVIETDGRSVMLRAAGARDTSFLITRGQR